MSKTRINDPREVVKPGDIVKVKVIDLEVARNRIALTLRLDDEVAKAGSKTRGGSSGKSRSSGATSRPVPASGGGALADALRRASEKTGRGKGGG
jgi:uncharacterized protein